MFSEVSRVAHVKVGVGEVRRVDKLADKDADLVAVFSRQDDIGVANLCIIKARIHLGSVRVARIASLSSLHLQTKTVDVEVR